MASADARTSIVIRDITTLAEMRAVEELQRQVWGIADREVFPALALIPMREVGAVLLGAFADEQMIGFVFGFPAHELAVTRPPGESRRLSLHSDMLAVSPAYRSHGLGYKLKLAQREQALANGVETITWTFDPLQSLNAHLNIGRLGAVVDSYRQNYYGETTSFLHGAGTDRLWVTWSLNSDRVRNRIEAGQPSPPLNLADLPTLVRVDQNDEPVSSDPPATADALVIEIPAVFNALAAKNAALAARWREATRQAFTSSITGGFFVAEFYRVTRQGQAVGAYLLKKSRAA